MEVAGGGVSKEPGEFGAGGHYHRWGWEGGPSGGHYPRRGWEGGPWGTAGETAPGHRASAPAWTQPCCGRPLLAPSQGISPPAPSGGPHRPAGWGPGAGQGGGALTRPPRGVSSSCLVLPAEVAQGFVPGRGLSAPLAAETAREGRPRPSALMRPPPRPPHPQKSPANPELFSAAGRGGLWPVSLVFKGGCGSAIPRVTPGLKTAAQGSGGGVPVPFRQPLPWIAAQGDGERELGRCRSSSSGAEAKLPSLGLRTCVSGSDPRPHPDGAASATQTPQTPHKRPTGSARQVEPGNPGL